VFFFIEKIMFIKVLNFDLEILTMRILLIHETFPPQVTGGGELLTLKTAKLLAEYGNDVIVLTTGNPRMTKYEGIKTVRVRINRYLMNITLPLMLKLVKKVDVVQVSLGNASLAAYIACKLQGKPIVCYVHHIFADYWKDIRGCVIGSVFQAMEKFYLSRSYDAVIFQNKSSLNLGIKVGINIGRGRLLTPGIDYRKFRMKVKKRDFVLFVGNLKMDKVMCKVKGVEYLIKAAEALKDVEFVIVGEGEWLRKIKLPSNVKLVGPLFGKDLIRIYNEALVFVLPSLNEGFGLTILEAMASGCSIVSTVDLGQEGFIVKPKDVNGLIESISWLIENRKEAIRIGKKNREIVKEFTWERYVKSLVKVYEEIIERKQSKF